MANNTPNTEFAGELPELLELLGMKDNVDEVKGLIEAQQKTITKTVSETLDHRIGGRYKRRSMMKSLVTAIT